MRYMYLLFSNIHFALCASKIYDVKAIQVKLKSLHVQFSQVYVQTETYM